MKFNPQTIRHIDDVLPTIKDNPAFIVKDKGFYTIVDYIYSSDKLFRDPIEIECRGLKFCSKTGRILSRGFHKFHNLDEREEYATENVDLSLPHVVLDKLDGSAIMTMATETGIYLTTRKGITEVAQAADKFLLANQIRYSNLFNSLPVDEYTYIFEYVAPTNKIVLDYEKEDLILTGIRHTINGTYVFFEELEALAKAFGISVVGINSHGMTSSSMLAKMVSRGKGQEGVVVRFDTGAMVKIKTEEYVRKHKSKDLIGSPKGIIGLIVENTLDDVLSQLDTDIRNKVVDYTKDFLTHLGRTITAVDLFAKGYEALPQKEYALKVASSLPRPLQSVAFLVRKGCDPKEETLNLLKRNLGTNKRIEELCAQLKLPLWTFSFFSEE